MTLKVKYRRAENSNISNPTGKRLSIPIKVSFLSNLMTEIQISEKVPINCCFQQKQFPFKNSLIWLITTNNCLCTSNTIKKAMVK